MTSNYGFFWIGACYLANKIQYVWVETCKVLPENSNLWTPGQPTYITLAVFKSIPFQISCGNTAVLINTTTAHVMFMYRRFSHTHTHTHPHLLQYDLCMHFQCSYPPWHCSLSNRQKPAIHLLFTT